MMKKTALFILVAIICLAIYACGGKEEDNVDNNESNYTPSGNAVANEDYFEWSYMLENQIIGYTEEGLKQTELVIPERCTAVISLSKNDTVKYIRFENPDTEIESAAFNQCTALEKIDLPANLEKVPNNSFAYCTALETVILPGFVSFIGNGAFSGCSSLKTVQLSENTERIGNGAFEDCTSLKEITLPEGITAIEEDTFENCTSLVTVNFGSKLKTVGEDAFLKCISLKRVVLPEGVVSLAADAFSYCDALEEIYLPSTIEEIRVSSIVQTHKIKVYVFEGSYMDSRLSELLAPENYDKQYQ